MCLHVETSLPLDLLVLHNLWTTFRRRWVSNNPSNINALGFCYEVRGHALVASFGTLSKALKAWKTTERRGIRGSTAHRPAHVTIPRITVSYAGSQSRTLFSAPCARLRRSPAL
jgi:hypothetical protein